MPTHRRSNPPAIGFQIITLNIDPHEKPHVLGQVNLPFQMQASGQPTAAYVRQLWNALEEVRNGTASVEIRPIYPKPVITHDHALALAKQAFAKGIQNERHPDARIALQRIQDVTTFEGLERRLFRDLSDENKWDDLRFAVIDGINAAYDFPFTPS